MSLSYRALSYHGGGNALALEHEVGLSCPLATVPLVTMGGATSWRSNTRSIVRSFIGSRPCISLHTNGAYISNNREGRP